MDFLKQFVANRPNLYFFSLGFFSILAAAPVYFFFIYFCVFTLLLHELFLLSDRKTLLKRSFFFGFGFSLSHFYWISFSFLVRGKLLSFFFPFVFVIIPAYFSIYYVLQFWLIHCLKERFNLGKVEFYFSFALSWVLFEFIRCNVLIFISLTGFPWGLLGYDIFFSDRLAQLASHVSVYILSLGILLVTAMPFLFKRFTKLNVFLFIVFLGGLFLLLCHVGGGNIQKYQGQEKLGISYKIVHPNISEHHGFDQTKLMNSLVSLKKLSNGGDEVDLVIWPEGAVSYLVDLENLNSDFLSFLTDGMPAKTTMILGVPRAGGGEGFYNSLIALNSNNQILDYYDKGNLVPFGEFVPYSSLFNIFPLVSNSGEFQSGDEDFIVDLERFSFTGLICYDALFPDIARGDGSEFIVNISNDIWFVQEIFGFNISLAPFQHLDMIRMRAIESGKTILRATNRGVSAVITPTGRVEQSLPYDRAGAITGSL